MEDSPNDYVTIVRSKSLLLKRGDKYVIGCVVSQTNEMTAEHKQYHEVIDPSPPEKEVFKMILEQNKVYKFIESTLIHYE